MNALSIEAEHSLILNSCRPEIEVLRSHNAGTDVVVIIDCAAPVNQVFARALGLQLPPNASADAYVLAIGLVPLEICLKAFQSNTFPKIAKALQGYLSTPLAYRTIVVTDRGATTAQNIYVPPMADTPPS